MKKPVVTTAMILAAGRGSRLRPLTDTLPKPLVEVGGVSLLRRHVEWLVAAGVTRIVINVAYLPDQIKAAVAEIALNDVEILFSDEPEGGLETAGGIIKALPLLDAEQFLVVNADIYTDYDFSTLLDAPLMDCLAHLVMVPVPPEKSQPDFYLHDNVVSNNSSGGRGLTFAGVSLMRSQLFEGYSEEFLALRPVLDAAIANGLISGESYEGFWCDVGTLERLEWLNRKLTF